VATPATISAAIQAQWKGDGRSGFDGSPQAQADIIAALCDAVGQSIFDNSGTPPPGPTFTEAHESFDYAVLGAVSSVTLSHTPLFLVCNRDGIVEPVTRSGASVTLAAPLAAGDKLYADYVY
jgi:hypothetical protein